MLIAALQVKIRRPSQIRSLLQYGCMTHTGIEPHIKNIGLFNKLPAAAGFTLRLIRQKLRHVLFKPYIGAVFLKQLIDPLHDLFIEQQLIAFFTIKNRNGYTPGPLS